MNGKIKKLSDRIEYFSLCGPGGEEEVAQATFELSTSCLGCGNTPMNAGETCELCGYELED